MRFLVHILALLCWVMTAFDNVYARLIVMLGSIGIIIASSYEQLHTEPYRQMIQMAHHVRVQEYQNQNNPKSIDPVGSIKETLLD